MPINLNDNVGKKLLALDIHVPCSPCLEVALPAEVDLHTLVSDLRDEFNDLLRSYLDGFEWVLQPIDINIHSRSGIIKTEEERRADYKAALRPLQESVAEGKALFDKNVDDHPNNGKLGYWMVEGVRHGVHYAKTTSARDAINKVMESGHLDDWEILDVAFVGDLPDVF